MPSNGATPAHEPRVLLTTTIHLPSTARLALALARNGCRVFAITPPHHPLRLIRDTPSTFSYRAFRYLDALENAIKDASADLLFPCDETAVRHLHQLHSVTARPATRALIERSLGNPDSYQAAEARHDLLIVARDAGVKVPATRAIRCPEDLHAWSREIALPWVLKADGSNAGLGVRIVSSAQDAAAAFHRLDRPVSASLALNKLVLDHDPFWVRQWRMRSRPAISIQSYIEGRPANCSVACWEGEVLAGIAMEVVVAESRTGPSMIGRVVDNPEMMDAARQVVRRLGLSGLVGFDFMIETATETPRMIEMNPRNTPVCHINLGPGRDLVGALIARLTGWVKPQSAPTTHKDIIAFFPNAWQIDPESELLHTAYHDVPWEEPALVNELIKPELRERLWFTRQVRRLKGRKPDRPLAFPASLPTRSLRQSDWQPLSMQDMG